MHLENFFFDFQVVSGRRVEIFSPSINRIIESDTVSTASRASFSMTTASGERIVRHGTPPTELNDSAKALKNMAQFSIKK
jgi:hypothetical protein